MDGGGEVCSLELREERDERVGAGDGCAKSGFDDFGIHVHRWYDGVLSWLLLH